MQQDAELLAAQAAKHVDWTQMLLTDGYRTPQHGVANGMPMGIVDLLEMIEIDRDQAGCAS